MAARNHLTPTTLALASILAASCRTTRSPTDPVVIARSSNFADHTVPAIADEQSFERLARSEGLIRAVKFIITDFHRPSERALRFYDSNFFKLHDEWYWFRLLNGALVPGDETSPFEGQRFANIPAVYQWAASVAEYPLDLVMYSDGRLYSPRFYAQSFGRQRRFGLGTLVSLPPLRGSTQRRWAFELEFGDGLSHEELMVFFAHLRQKLPPAIASDLRFLVRSPAQETLAREMARAGLAEHQRIIRYSEIVEPGTREVYSAGITAGYIRFIRADEGIPATNSEQVLVFERTPDLLPPAAGVLTAVPQTPLAHVNLLARNRGIPNAMLAGALQHPMLMQLARGYAPVLFSANGTDDVVVAPLTEEEFRRYRAMNSVAPRSVRTPDPSRLPYVQDLSMLRPTDITSVAPSLGGKATGFIALLAAHGSVSIPDKPHAISTRAYTEHLAPLRDRIGQVISDTVFDSDIRVRELVLEGRARFLERHRTQEDRDFVQTFCDRLGSSELLGDLARGHGVRGLIERTPITPQTLAEIHRALSSAYSFLAPTQGLRFRSSSNAEDIEGFNGAGLYESFTGFLDARSQRTESDQRKTIERAIQRVWGSFWGFEAFEERRGARIEHLTAAMAVVVHPRFDDAIERSTGVCTLTVHGPTSPDRATLVINIQLGAESVANPDPAKLPEVLTVRVPRDGSPPRVERGRLSTLSPSRALLSDDAARALYAQLAPVADAWLARENAGVPQGRHRRGLTLDFEFHEVLEGWPARRDGARAPARMVIKQVRTLEPGSRVRVEGADEWPVPREVLSRARRVERERCQIDTSAGRFELERLRVTSDRTLPPDVGYAEVPLDAELRIAFGALRARGFGPPNNGASSRLEHWEIRTSTEGTSVVLAPSDAARAGFDRIVLGADHSATIERDRTRESGLATCRSELLYATGRDYLASLLADRVARR
ncbi:MAG: hypothetical protein JNK05_06370 [Myxococcales bacterium]|nr:hypothetical protein [Myxococcales bacterium]